MNKVFWSKKLKKYVTVPLKRWKELQKLAAKTAAILLLCALPAYAGPLQVKNCLGNGHPCAFDQPLTAGTLRIVVEVGTYSATLATMNTVSDTQNNAWKLAIAAPNFNGIGLQYALGGPAGYDTVMFAPNTGWVVMLAEYPPSTGLDGANTGTYSYDNLDGDKNGQSSDITWAHPIVTHESCELLIGWSFLGSFGGPWIASAGPGFTIRSQVDGALALEDMTTTIPGVYIGSVTYNNYAHWDMGIASFKTGGCH